MNINKLFIWYNTEILESELSKLKLKDLELLHQSLLDQITRYQILSKNYSYDRMLKFGNPHKQKLQDILSILLSEIKQKS